LPEKEPERELDELTGRQAGCKVPDDRVPVISPILSCVSKVYNDIVQIVAYV